MSVFYTIKGKRFLYVMTDAAMDAASWIIAFVITYYPERVSGLDLLRPRAFIMLVLPLLLAFYFFQIYRIMWAYFNVKDVYRLLGANTAGILLSIAGFTAAGMEFPRVMGVLAFLLTCGGTVFYRVFIRGRLSVSEILPGSDKNASPWWTKNKAPEKRIIIAGAGEAGRMILAEYGKKGMDRSVIGFVDDDPEKIGRILGGKMVLGPSRDIAGVIRNRKISEIIIAMPSIGSAVIDRIVSHVKSENPSALIRTLPPFTRIFEKSLSPDLRELDIGDLLGREEFGIDVPAIESHFAGKTILVTGAGGSIGSEICKQLLKFNIKRLVALGRGEFSIYTLAKTLGEYMYYLESDTEIIYRIADVKDRAMLETVFAAFRPDIVFHAAAHKHVPLMEFNEIEAVQNNIIGSLNVFEVSLKHGAGECVMVSTDKAVHPVNVMGATKRAAELLACYYFRERGLKTSIVRFGNVLGSRGSVIPLFREQIERGGPVTVTHPDITRYFMSIPEASILVINAAAYTTGGEVFVLDMGKQFRVADIARNLIRLYGYQPDRDIRIEYTGLRPGEKLYEELFYSREKLVHTRNEKIYILQPDAREYDGIAIEIFMGEKLSGLFSRDSMGVRNLIRELVPEYDFESPQDETGKTRLVN